MGLDLGAVAAGARGYVEGTQRKEAIDRANRSDDLRDETSRLQLDEIKKDSAYQDLTRKHQAAVGALLQSGGTDLEPMKDYFRSTPGSQFEDLTRAEDGSYDFKVGGKSHKIKDADSLGTMSMMGLDPKTYLKHKQEIEKTKQSNAGKNTFTDDQGYLMRLDENNVAQPIVDAKGKRIKAQTFGGRRLGAGAGGNASSDIQFLNWATEKLGIDENDAMGMLFDLKHNPERAVASIYAKRVEAVEKNYFPTDPNKPSREQIKQEVLADMDEIMGSTRPAGIKRGGKGKGAEPAADPMGGFINREPRAAGTGVTAFKFGVPGGSGAPAEGGAMRAPSSPSSTLPPKAIQALKNAGGKPVRFNNGQTWKIGPDGQPVQVK